MEETICSCPAISDDRPEAGNLYEVGLKPYTPLQAAGERMEPPLSVPMPRQEPRIPSKAPSPPELPPLVNVVLNGFTVTLG